MKHEHYAIPNNLLFRGKKEVWAPSTEGHGHYTIKPETQTTAWSQGRRTYRKDTTIPWVFFINCNVTVQSVLASLWKIILNYKSKTLTTFFILKQTHSKHTYKAINRKRILSAWQIQNILFHIYIIYFKFGIHLFYAKTCIKSRYSQDQPRWERALSYLRNAAEGLDWFIWQWVTRLTGARYRTK